jgi:hypothetical protein
MNSDTRAALVAMGQQMDRAREVLAVTERRSIEQVYRNDFRVRDVPKSPKEPPAPKTKKPEYAIAQSNRVAEIADALLADFGDQTPFPRSTAHIRKYAVRSLKTPSSERTVPLVGEALWAA